MFGKVRAFFSLVQFSHSLFALPFAASVVFVNGYALPALRECLLLLGALVCARNAAMGVNRYADRFYDALNTRTAGRVLVSGRLTERDTLVFVVLFSLGFCVFSFFLSVLCAWLAPLLLLALFFYSFWKRFSFLCHLYLGMMIALSVLGVDLALSNGVTANTWLLFAVVTLWVFGFDLLYSLLDLDFDRRFKLCSIPARFGVRVTLLLSRCAYVGAVVVLLLLGVLNVYGWVYYFAVFCVGAILLVEHFLVRPHDLSRIHIAFFYCNSCVGFVVLCAVVIEYFF